jgi:cytosine deaminase
MAAQYDRGEVGSMSVWSSLPAGIRAASRGFTLAGAMALTGEKGEGRIADVAVGADGRIERVADPGEAGGGGPRFDVSGLLIAPGFVDAHQHLDKTGLLGLVDNPSGTLQGAREAFAGYSRRAPPGDVAARARRTMARCLARGTIAIRAHTNIDIDSGLGPMEQLREVRAAWADRMILQLVAFVSAPRAGTNFDWILANIDAGAAGADVIGGTPAMAENPGAYLDILFEAAARRGLPVDLHLDEHLEPERQLFDIVFERVRRFGMQGRVVLSHASVLSAIDDDAFARIRDQILELDLGVITLPAANLYIQGRGQERLPPRGLTRVLAFVRAGARIAAASDNIQDPFIPTGSGDLLEIARWTLLAGHLHANDLPSAYGMITHVPAKLMGIDADYGLRAGASANLVIMDGVDAQRMIAGGPDRRIVLFKGRPVAPDFAD